MKNLSNVTEQEARRIETEKMAEVWRLNDERNQRMAEEARLAAKIRQRFLQDV